MDPLIGTVQKLGGFVARDPIFDAIPVPAWSGVIFEGLFLSFVIYAIRLLTEG